MASLAIHDGALLKRKRQTTTIPAATKNLATAIALKDWRVASVRVLRLRTLGEVDADDTPPLTPPMSATQTMLATPTEAGPDERVGFSRSHRRCRRVKFELLLYASLSIFRN